MTGPSFVTYEEFNPAKKTAEWYDQTITIIRRDWRRIVQSDRALENKRLLLSEQSMKHIADQYDDVEFKKNIDFKPLPIWETILNTLIEEITKNPPKVEVFATDPSAINDKKKDINILKSRKLPEGVISQAQRATGGPPNYKLPQDSYNSNIEEFDNMGLNENDPDDVSFFSQNYHRLFYELGAQSLLDAIFKLSRFDEEYIEPMVIDALAHKVTCLDCYVDKLTGEIKHKYVYPEIAYVIPGNSADGHDDIAKGWEDMITIWEFLQLVGNAFVFERDWMKLLYALNYANSSFRYTGFTRNGMNYDCCNNPVYANEMNEKGMDGWDSLMCDWTQAYTYKVYFGKIQWLTGEATLTYIAKGGDKKTGIRVPYDYELSEMEVASGYQKESNYQQQAYGSYYLATTSISQYIFDPGKIYYMQTEGANDEYAFGTLMYYRKRGRSAAELSVPYIDIANETFYRMRWAIYHAKIDSDTYDVDELVEVSKWIDKENANRGINVAGQNFQAVMQEIIQMQKEKAIRLRARPRVDGVPASMMPTNDRQHNGLDPLALSMQACVSWAIQQITTQVLSMNSLRLGQNQDEREGFKLNMEETQNSLTSTGYIYRMIQYPKERLAGFTLNYAQDIVKFKDSIPYNYLRNLVGDEAFGQILSLKDFAAHRYAIFVRDRNMQMEKMELISAARQAFQQGKLEINQYYIILSTEDVKKAFKLLDFMKMKQNKKLRQQQIQDQQQQQKMQQQAHDQAMELEQAKRQTLMMVEQLRGKNETDVAQINSQGKIQVKQISIGSDAPKQQAKEEAQKGLATHKANLEAEKAYNS